MTATRFAQRAAALLVVFFSGSAALLFETLFYRVASLSLGVSQWAIAAVLAGFMLGLGGGALAVLRAEPRITNPGRLFIQVELLAAISALLVVFYLLGGSAALSGWLSGLRDTPVLQLVLRLVVAILLFALPAGAMGATLPLWIRAVGAGHAPESGRDGGFGVRLGLLYGINVSGAVAGALACELWLVRLHGIPFAAGAGVVASVCAVLCAWWYLRGRGATPAPAPAPVAGTRGQEGVRWPAGLLLASFLCGLGLLGLEVAWFRFLHLYVINASLTFAVMLSLLLAAGAAGSLGYAAFLARFPGLAERGAVALALFAAVATLGCYWAFSPGAGDSGTHWSASLGATAGLTARLVCLPAFLSGALFTAVGHLLGERMRSDLPATAAWLASNTLGAVTGSLAAGFLLLPWLGLQGALQLLSAAYLGTGILLLMQWRAPRARRAGMAVFVVMLASVPLLPAEREIRALAEASQKYRDLDGSRTVLVRQGRGETLQYLRRDYLGEPLYYRQMVDGFSMSATTLDSRRYMELYAWLPAALHPGIGDALLISYGLGTTASALLDIPGLRSLDVVDISPEILATSEIVHPAGQSPLQDGRTRVHIADGRFFLRAPPRRYDLVTGEPPPPRARGVVNLYTREYFQLVHDALNPGGWFSYWLPVDQMTAPSARAILRAFCEVFADCALWAGANYNWMLTGTRAGGAPPSFSDAPWRDPAVGGRLQAIGVEAPGALAATFIADTQTLRNWTRDVAPLVDAHPGRLDFEAAGWADLALYFRWMDDVVTEQRFRESAQIHALFPETVRTAAAGYFPFQALLNNQVRPESAGALPALDALLQHSTLRAPVYWLLGSDDRRQEIAGRATVADDEVRWQRAVHAIAERTYHRALDWVRSGSGHRSEFRAQVQLYLYCRTGRTEEAERFGHWMLQEAGWRPRFACDASAP